MDKKGKNHSLTLMDKFEQDKNSAIMVQKICNIFKSDKSDQYTNHYFLKLEKDRRYQEKVIQNIASHPHIFKVKGNLLQNSVTKVHNPRFQVIREEVIIRSDSGNRNGGLSKIKSQKQIINYQKNTHRLPPMDYINGNQRNGSQIKIQKSPGRYPESGTIHQLQIHEENSLNSSSNHTKSNQQTKRYIPMIFKDDPSIPVDRKVVFQEMVVLNNKKEFMVEISFAQTKLVVIAARKRAHFSMEFPKKQARRLIYDVCGSCENFANQVRISKAGTLYVEGLKDLLSTQVENVRQRNLSQSEVGHQYQQQQYYNNESQQYQLPMKQQPLSNVQSTRHPSKVHSQIQLTPIEKIQKRELFSTIQKVNQTEYTHGNKKLPPNSHSSIIKQGGRNIINQGAQSQQDYEEGNRIEQFVSQRDQNEQNQNQQVPLNEQDEDDEIYQPILNQ
eukprot:403354312